MLKEKFFSIIEAFKFAFETSFQNFGFFFKLLIVRLLVYLLLRIIGIFFFGEFPSSTKGWFNFDQITIKLTFGWLSAEYQQTPVVITTGILIFLFLIFGIHRFMKLGMNKIQLNFYDKKRNSLEVLFSQKNLILRSILGSVIYFFIVTFGLMLFVFPGIIWAIMFGFYQYVMIDENIGVFQAFRRSAAIVSGYKWQLFALSLFAGLFLGGSLSLQRGIIPIAFMPVYIFVEPFLSMLWIYAYRKLKEKNEQSPFLNGQPYAPIIKK